MRPLKTDLARLAACLHSLAAALCDECHDWNVGERAVWDEAWEVMRRHGVENEGEMKCPRCHLWLPEWVDDMTDGDVCRCDAPRGAAGTRSHGVTITDGDPVGPTVTPVTRDDRDAPVTQRDGGVTPGDGVTPGNASDAPPDSPPGSTPEAQAPSQDVEYKEEHHFHREPPPREPPPGGAPLESWAQGAFECPRCGGPLEKLSRAVCESCERASHEEDGEGWKAGGS